MSDDNIRKIRKTEKEAEDTIARAMTEAKDILKQSRNQAYKIVEQREDEGEKEARKIIKNSKEEAQVDIVDIQHKIAGECNEIRKKAKPYMKEATKFVAARIIGQDVNS